MVCLRTKRKKKVIGLVLIGLFILVALFLTYFLFFYEKTIDDQNKDNEWNKTDENAQKEPIDPLYNLTEVPKLESLFINPDFIKWINIKQLPYLHGYSSDGKYAAFIYYNASYQGYIIQVYDIFIGEVSYSTFIQDSENLIESKELDIVQDALDNSFAIEIVPEKLYWSDSMEYVTEKDTWLFENETRNKHSYLSITNTDNNEEWHILQNKYIFFDESTQLFTHPEKPELLVFIFKQKLFDYSSTVDYTPYFVQLNKLTVNNSEKGKNEEADKWLYDEFKFIYEQWDSGSSNGFLAVSKDNNEISEKKYSDSIEQWVYLDPLGKMKWYGNARGIFNAEGKAIQKNDRIYYYRLRIMTDHNLNSIDYLVVDQYEANTNNVIRTIEFIWDYEKQELKPIQEIQIFESNDNN